MYAFPGKLFTIESMGDKILVTGADGFIGSHLTEALVREGFTVRAFVHYNSFNSWGWLDYCDKSIKAEIEVLSGDIRDPNGVRNAVKECDSVLHLAALIAIPYSYNSPSAYLETNVGGTLNILQASRDFGVRRVIHTSTSEVYGTAKFVPITEDHPIQGQSPYSATKIAADQLAYSFFSSFELPVVTIRPFNTFGPRQSARAVIPTIITQLATKNLKLKLGAVTPTRDFSYIDDTVSGFIAALKSDKGIGQVFNLGGNFEVSIKETCEIIAEIMSEDCEVTLDEARIRPDNSEVERLWSDNRKAIKTLGWNPKFQGRDGFVKGLVRTIEWFSRPENLSLYKPGIYNL